MRTAPHSRSFLGLSVLSALLCAQGVAAAQEPKPAPKKEAQAPAKQPKEAAAPVAAAREITLPVSGLTKEGVEALRADLLALSSEVFACPTCTVEQMKQGTCPKCKAPLVPETRQLFTAVGSSTQDNVLTLTTDPLAHVRLSRVETALKAKSLEIDDELFLLSGRTELYVQGAPLDAATIQKALTESKLFDEVKASADPVTNQIVVMVRADSVAPSRAKVMAVLEDAKAELVDVVWGQPIPPKS